MLGQVLEEITIGPENPMYAQVIEGGTYTFERETDERVETYMNVPVVKIGERYVFNLRTAMLVVMDKVPAKAGKGKARGPGTRARRYRHD
jgi:hypothetical protein